MFTRAFWKDAAERAVSTAAQSALLVMGADGLFNLFNVDAKAVAGVAAGGAVLSALKALAARFVNNPQSASLVDLDDVAGEHAADR